jgi:hypothetical protein
MPTNDKPSVAQDDQLKKQAEQQREQDFDALLLPSAEPGIAEEAARKMAVDEVRQARAGRASHSFSPAK